MEDGRNISLLKAEVPQSTEIVGDTKVKVAVEDDEEPWDVIEDVEYTTQVEQEIDKSINSSYLNKEENNKKESLEKK